MPLRVIVFWFCVMACMVVTAKDRMAYYLFAYFTDNSTEGQQVCYAVSSNGLDFTPLNGGRPVLSSDTVSISGERGRPHVEGIFLSPLPRFDDVVIIPGACDFLYGICMETSPSCFLAGM